MYIQCPECDRKMIPKRYDGRSRTATFVCSNESTGIRDIEDCKKEITLQAELSTRKCPHCAEDRKKGHLVEIGMTQNSQGYDYTQNYYLQCITCGQLSVETVNMKSVNYYRVFRGFHVCLDVKDSIKEAKEVPA